jgi:quinoprotein glucose dehydrogenase
MILMSRSARVALPAAFLVLLPAAYLATLPPDRALSVSPQATQEKPYEPKIAPASDEPLRAMKRIRVPAGLKIDLWAAEPLLANPVAFAFDEKGRAYVAETFRLHAGVTDNRFHDNWVDADLASWTVADRVAMYRKYLGKNFARYAVEHDRVRLLEDTRGTGRAERSTVFADGFKDHATGIGAGILARGGKVWYACIPDLWLLQDTKGTGSADVKKSLQHGYGVHVAFLGHDLHGLRFGPDGKLYFSIGDRGLHVETGGRTVSCPDSGAVLRCNPDGSELEGVATGLRNPQELAFDQYGNLFTADNNADSGDQARWVYVVEGGDSGWRVSYQYMKRPARLGPWNAEKLWHVPRAVGSPDQAAYLVPPLAHIADGPSGLTYNPGVTLLPDRYKDHFFLCDFRGGSGNSGIHAFTLRPRGAAFELVGRTQFAWSILATDCEFAPDGGFYLSDWVEGWNLPGKGRIYKLFDSTRLKDPKVAEVKKLLAEGMGGRGPAVLARLLSHPDQRVRQEAQFALAALPAGEKVLLRVAREAKELLPRLHALWGLGQLALKGDRPAETVLEFLKDRDPEVRAQAAKVVGQRRVTPTWARDPIARPPGGWMTEVYLASKKVAEHLSPLLEDESLRVRFFAAQSLGRIGRREARSAILKMIRANADADPYLRHAGVMAVNGCFDPDSLRALARDESPSVRLAVVLALRRRESADAARFLNDTDPRVVLEAARAINDVPINEAMPELAKLIEMQGLSAPVLYRVLNANFRLGKAENARALAAFAARKTAPEALRIEALEMLAQWASPSGRDRVVGLWRPLSQRPAEDAVAALKPALGGILTGPAKVRSAGASVSAKLGIRAVGPALLALVADPKQPAAVRVETLKALQALDDSSLEQAMKLALADDHPRVRAQGWRARAHLEPDGAVAVLTPVLESGSTPERQAALDVLGGLNDPAADRLLGQWLDRLVGGKVPPEVRLDLLEAAQRRHARTIRDRLARYEASRVKGDKLAPYREALAGGDAEAGRHVFFYKTEASCLRCHKIGGEGGEVGPDLAGIGSRQTREYLLESIVDPNRQIAKGYETVVLTLADGQVKSGILKSEDAKVVRLITSEGAVVTIPKEEIDQRTRGPSAMPEDLARQLSRRELRDLVEFLANLKAAPR